MEVYELELDLPTHRPQFLLGPVCLDWLAKASKRPGKALAVAIILIHIGRITGNPNWVKLKPSLLKKFGVHRNAGYRAIEQIEQAGLIEVKQRKRGAAVVVSLVNPVPRGMTWVKGVEL
jgi:hypothetical protein